MFKMKKLKIDPIIVLIMAVIAALPFPVSYTHLTLPTNREV